MQYKNNQYDKNFHERKKALTVKNPYAEWIAQGKKQIEIRSTNTKYRGELVICSSQNPEIQEMQSGCMLALVELYDVKPLSEITPGEWLLTMIPVKDRKNLKGFAWFLKNPIRVVEYPVKGQLGIWNLVVDKMEFIPYGSETLKDIDVNLDVPVKYNSKATRDGCLFIIITFAILLLIVGGLWWLIFT